MVSIGDGIRQYTINTPTDFNIDALVKRICLYQINHGAPLRNELTGPNPEYQKMINYSDTDYEFMSWYGYIADYVHAVQILRAVEISNDGKSYEP